MLVGASLCAHVLHHSCSLTQLQGCCCLGFSPTLPLWECMCVLCIGLVLMPCFAVFLGYLRLLIEGYPRGIRIAFCSSCSPMSVSRLRCYCMLTTHKSCHSCSRLKHMSECPIYEQHNVNCEHVNLSTCVTEVMCMTCVAEVMYMSYVYWPSGAFRSTARDGAKCTVTCDSAYCPFWYCKLP